jgi:transcriptional regulator with XRE-family HTH domain
MNQHEILMQATCAVLQELRLKKELSQADLAKLSGLHRSYIGDAERGARSLSITNVARMAEALEVSASSLVELAEQKMAESKFEKSSEIKTQVKLEARVKTMAKDLARARTKIKALTKTVAQAKAKAQSLSLALAQTKATARAKLKAETEARRRAEIRAQAAVKPTTILGLNATTRRCLNGHRWTGVRKSCPTCHFTGFLINP